MAREGAGGDGVGRGEEDFRFLVAHAAGEISVGGRDAIHRLVHAAEGVNRAAEAGGAGGVLRHLHAGGFEDVPDRFIAGHGVLQFVDDVGRGGYAEGVDLDAATFQHLGEGEEVGGFAAGAGADVGAIKVDLVERLGQRALAGIGVHGHGGLERGEVELLVVDEALVLIELDGLVVGLGAVALGALVDVGEGLLVRGKKQRSCRQPRWPCWRWSCGHPCSASMAPGPSYCMAR